MLRKLWAIHLLVQHCPDRRSGQEVNWIGRKLVRWVPMALIPFPESRRAQRLDSFYICAQTIFPGILSEFFFRFSIGEESLNDLTAVVSPCLSQV